MTDTRTLFRLALVALLAMAALAPRPAAAQNSLPDLLVDDAPTTSGWQASRAQLDTSFEGVRAALRAESFSQMTEAIESLQEALEGYEAFAVVMAHGSTDEVERLLDRLDMLIDRFLDDYEGSSVDQLLSTLRLMEQTLARLEEVSLLSDLRAGRTLQQPLAGLPPDWDDLKYANPGSRTGYAVYSARELVDGITHSRSQLQRQHQRRGFTPADRYHIEEMSEMARALVLRQGEFPELMRPGFRNSVLQLEVIVENLGDFHGDRNRLAFRRQLIELERSLARTEAFFELRERIAQQEQSERAASR